MYSARTFGTISTIAIFAILASVTPRPASAQSVSIEVTTTKQKSFSGFGAAIGNTIGEFLPSGGRADTPGSVANSIYNLLLSPKTPTSLNLSFLRFGLNADNYQQSNTAAYDFPSSVIKMGEADIIKAAKTRNPNIKLYTNLGSPPFWMKENGADFNASDPVTFSPDAPTTNHLLATEEAACAAFMKQYTTDFKSYFGYPIDVFSLQNEPDVNVNFYGCCLYPDSSAVDPKAATYLDTLKALRTAIPKSSATQIWGPECTSCNNTAYFSSAAAANELNAICTHDYGSNCGNLPISKRNGLAMGMTEYGLYQSSFLINGQPDQAWMTGTMADSFCKDANDGQVTAWFWWNMVGVNKAYNNGPSDTGQSLIIANGVTNPSSVYKSIDQSGLPPDHSIIALDDNTKYPASGGPYESPWQFEFGSDWTLTSKYYAFRRLTQTIVPDSVNMLTKTTPNYLQASGGQDDVYATAFKLPSGKYCIVIANQSSKAYATTLKVDALTSAAYTGFTVYYTSENGSTPVNDVSWNDTLANGQETTTVWPYSQFCYVQQ